MIVGGSYIALEFSQMFRRFGSRVTLLVRGDRILAREDADISKAIQDVLEREGIEFRFGAQLQHVAPDGEGVRIQYANESIVASHLLFASSRRDSRRIPMISVSSMRISR